MWLGLTIARSSPASTQWCRNTLLSTERAGRPTPKETLETPSEVWTPGISVLIARIPSIVATALGRHSGSPGGQGEGEAVEDERVGVQAVLLAAQLRDPLGDLQLALGGLGHPDLVDGQRDHRGAVLLGQRHDLVELVAAGLEVDRVDDRAPGDLLQRGLDHVGLGRVDLDRRRLGQRDPLDHLAHLVGLVLALGQRHADVEHVGAAGDLVLGDDEQAVVVVGQQQLLGLARALGVDALADDRGAGGLDHRRGRDHRAHVRRAPLRARSPGGAVLDPLGHRLDVGRRGAAAAADDRDAVALDELTQGVGQRPGLLGEDRLAVGALEREAGVGYAVHRHRAELAEEADRVAHVLGAGGAVEADDVDLERLQRGQHRADVGAQEHLAALGQQRDAALDRDRAGGRAPWRPGARRTPRP